MGNFQHEKISEGETKYNSSADTLERIGDEWKQCAIARRMDGWQGYMGWRLTLETIDSELSAYMKPEEIALVKGLRVDSDPSPQARKLMGGVVPVSMRSRLDQWERALRKIHASKGMALVSKDTDTIFILPGGK